MVERAAALGLDAIALTDHDTLAGVAEAQAAGEALGVRVVAGCEFSVRAEWGEAHLLGYFLPSDEPVLADRLAGWQAARRIRAERIVQLLGRHGVALSLDDVVAEAGGGAIGRPHVARALVRRAAVRDPQDAFDQWLGKGRPAFVAKELPVIPDVTALIHEVGGVAVMAHLGDRGTEGQLERFRQQGVDGVEVRHPSHDPVTERRLAALAVRLGLVMTGGSDWHGDDKRRERAAPLGGVPVPTEWLTCLEDRRDRTTGAR